jgi:hypothetical protein
VGVTACEDDRLEIVSCCSLRGTQPSLSHCADKCALIGFSLSVVGRSPSTIPIYASNAHRGLDALLFLARKLSGMPPQDQRRKAAPPPSPTTALSVTEACILLDSRRHERLPAYRPLFSRASTEGLVCNSSALPPLTAQLDAWPVSRPSSERRRPSSSRPRFNLSTTTPHHASHHNSCGFRPRFHFMSGCGVAVHRLVCLQSGIDVIPYILRRFLHFPR